MLLCALSVDLDEVDCYAQIHGLDPSTPPKAVYTTALPRIEEFAASFGIPITLFVVARDLGMPANVKGLERLVQLGHELGNHSLGHFYDLTHRDVAEQTHQVEEANVRIHAACGVHPTGFRAPGYTVSDQLLRVLGDCGMRYDSSVFPCPSYYAAKAASLLRLKLNCRTSRSILDTPRVLLAPTTPYRVGRPYWSRGNGLLELPIQVAGRLRLPFIGTVLTLLGPSAARLLTRGVLGEPLVNLELHGIDFLDSCDVPGELERSQPDLKIPWPKKRDSLAAVIELLRANGYSFVRMDEAASAFAGRA